MQSHWRLRQGFPTAWRGSYFFFVADVLPITSRAGMISLPNWVGIYTKLKLVHWTLDVHHSCTSLLSFTFKNNSLNFVQKKRKNISWYGAETMAQHEIPFMHFLKISWKCTAQHAILNLIVCQIKGEYQFIELEHAVLLLWIKRRIMSGVKWSIFDEGYTATVTLLIKDDHLYIWMVWS